MSNIGKMTAEEFQKIVEDVKRDLDPILKAKLGNTNLAAVVIIASPRWQAALSNDSQAMVDYLMIRQLSQSPNVMMASSSDVMEAMGGKGDATPPPSETKH